MFGIDGYKKFENEEDYDANTLIFLIEIKQDSIKEVYTRSSTGILDYLGDVGGF